MRKMIITLLLFMLLTIPLFAEENEPTEETFQDSDILHVTAYKNAPMPENLINNIMIQNFNKNGNDEQITGSTDSFEISHNTASYTNALKLTVKTNQYDDINFDIFFFPFVNKYDSSDFYTVKYTITGETATEVSFTESSYDYIYSAQWNKKSGFTKNGNTYYVNVTTGSGSFVTVVNKITAKRRKGSANYSNFNVSNKTGGIPGIGTNLIKNVMIFDMEINFRDRTPVPNVKYEARIRLVISAF